jgi:phage-related protein
VAVKAFFYMVAGLITALLIPTLLELFATILANPITWIIMLLAGLALAIEDLVVWSEGGESALGDLWEAIFGSPDEAKKTFAEIQHALTDIWETIKPLTKAFLEFYKSLDLKDKALFNIFPVLSMARYGLEAFIEWVKGAMTGLANWINEQFTAVGEWVNGVFQSISDTASSVVSAIEGFFAGLRDSIMSLIGEAIDWAIGKLAELAAAVKSTPIIGGAIDYVTGGGGTTNNTVSSKYNVIVNTNATDAEGTGRAVGNAMMGYNARMANGGVK